MNGCKGAGTIVLPVVQRLVSRSILRFMLILFFFRVFQMTHNLCQLPNRDPVCSLQDNIPHSQLITNDPLYLPFNLNQSHVLTCFFLPAFKLSLLIRCLLFYHPNPQNQYILGIVASLTHPPCYFYSRFLLFSFLNSKTHSVTETCEMWQQNDC